MRRYVIASHHKFASGLKQTLQFLSGRNDLYAISAYTDEIPIENQIKELFSGFNDDDEIIIMTDMLRGSVNQRFFPYMNDHVHLICGINVPCALGLILQPDGKITSKSINEMIDEARSQMIYVNEYQVEENNGDE